MNKTTAQATTTTAQNEYLYNFVGGGFNAEFAASREEATAAAILRWSDSDTLTVNVDSVRLATKADHALALSLFY